MIDEEKELYYHLAVSLIPRVGSVLFKNLLSYCGSIEAVFSTPKGKLLKVPGIGEYVVEEIVNAKIFNAVDSEIALAKKNNVTILHQNHKDYPHRLKQIYDSPPILYKKGHASLEWKKPIAIVGTRDATEYGKRITEEIVESLQNRKDVAIVSGLAYGIDVEAHKAALKYKIPTIAVMANGIGTVYPALHKDIAKKIESNGALVTENKFGSKPDAPKFPARNRIIAGLSDAVVVVQAKKKGGALITAELANAYDREVLAVCGDIHDENAKGCHYLIKSHKAHLFTEISDLEKLLNWDLESTTKKAPKDVSSLSKAEAIVYAIVKDEPVQIDKISFQANVPLNQLASILLQLEFKGFIKPLPGKRFCSL